jgi:hypothetical protein
VDVDRATVCSSRRTPDPAEYRSRQRALGNIPLHHERQDTDCDAWKRLLELVEEAVLEEVEIFAPLERLKPGEEIEIVTLPPTIAKLKSVKGFYLQGSSLVRIPPEIGEMSNLEYFDDYISYRLHWVSLRDHALPESSPQHREHEPALRRWAFPRLEGETASGEGTGHRCSVCQRPFSHAPHRAWISLWVGTDVLPLLVNACSQACIERLPKPPDGYVQEPHRGGPELQQPDSTFFVGPPLVIRQPPEDAEP